MHLGSKTADAIGARQLSAPLGSTVRGGALLPGTSSAGSRAPLRTPTKPHASAPMQSELYLASSPAAGAITVHEHKRFLTVLPADDSLAIANNSGNNIQIISANGALRRNLGSRGDAPGQFLGPCGLACDGQAIYVTDWCHRVQKLKLDGTSIATACEYGSGEGQLCFPTGAALAGGVLFVADTLNNRVVRFEAETLKWLSTFGGEGRAEGQFLGPSGLATTEDEVFVVDGHGQRIQVFNLQGEFVRTFGSWGTEPGQFDGPRGIAVANGHLYVAELGTALGGGGRVQELSLDGRPLQVLESPAGSPLYGVCVVSRQDCTPNNSSALYVTGADDSKLHVFIAANGTAVPQR